MRLYLDASALVALHARENHTPTAQAAVLGASSLAASELAYPEARAGLAAQRRNRRLTAPRYARALRGLETLWPQVAAVELGPALSRVAGDLAEAHGLKGADAVHLASALWLGSQPEGVALLSFDATLTAAARTVGLPLWTPPAGGADPKEE